jgi:HSP20 family protein
MLTGWIGFDETLKALDLLQQHMDRSLDPWSGPARRFPRLGKDLETVWPATNIFETKEAFLVRAEVPGIAEGGIAVSVEDDALVIRGERKSEVPEGYKVHLRERAPIAFTRKVALPARVDADAVSATLSRGVLTVTLPKSKEALPRQIAVKSA